MTRRILAQAGIIAGILLLAPGLVRADGINTAGDKALPIGAGGSTYLYLTSTGRLHFGEKKDEPVAWINKDGGAKFGKGGITISGTNSEGAGLSVAQNIKVGQNQFLGTKAAGVGFWNGNGGVLYSGSGSLSILKNVLIGTTDNPKDLKVSKITVPGAVNSESLDYIKMNNIINLANLTKCTTGEVLTKEDADSFKCRAISGDFMCPTGEALVGFIDGVPKCETVTLGCKAKLPVDCVNGNPKPGDLCQDGTLYAGLSPDGHIKMFTTPCDAGDPSQITGQPDAWEFLNDNCSCTETFKLYNWQRGSQYKATGIVNPITGAANTEAILAYNEGIYFKNHGKYYTPKMSSNYAADFCTALDAFGHNDWYLPAKAEQDVLCENRSKIGGFQRAWNPWVEVGYFSSTELSEEPGWDDYGMYAVVEDIGQNKYACTPFPEGGPKDNQGVIRCVRKSGCRAKVDCVNGNPSPGDMCLDGTIYTGLSPDGNVKMYTTPCTAGQTWDGCSACTGSPALKVWVPWYGTTGFQNRVTGKANSAGLAAKGSNYQAAMYCESLIANGHSDWYLPAIYESRVLSDNYLAIGGFVWNEGEWTSTPQGYWSSTEADEGSANSMSCDTVYYDECSACWGDDNCMFYDKAKQLAVRCVRR